MTNNQVKYELKRSSLGVPAIVFLVVAAAAPLAATLGAGPVVFILGGTNAPVMYLIASLILLLFAIGFATMSKHVTSAGGFASYISQGMGRAAGYAAAGLALLAYIGMLSGLFGQLAIFTADLIEDYLNVAVPWQVLAIVALVLVGVFGYLNIDLSAKILGVLLILEVAIVLIFDIAVFAQAGSEGINFDAFNLGTIDLATLGVAVLFAAACFVGFEATVIYGEEAKNPKRTVARATYWSVGIIGVFYTMTMWALGLAYGTDRVQGAAAENPVEFVFEVNTAFVGLWSTRIMQVLVVTSLIAVLLAFHNTLSRYVFSLSRSRFLPQTFAQTHPRFRSPHRSSLLVSAVTLVILAAFILAGGDPFAHLYLWMVGVGSLGVLVLQAAGSAAVVGYFIKRRRRNLPSEGSIWSRLIAPGLGAILLAVIAVLAIINFSELSGATEGPATLLPWLVIVAMVIGIIVGVVRSRKGDPIDVGTEYTLDEQVKVEEARRSEHDA